jgi:hypothetical protein
LLASAGLLAAAAGVLLAFGDRSEPKSAEFHRLVGGIGGGSALDLSRCAGDFDPRLDPDCHFTE